MKRIKQLLLWLADGIWYAMLLLAFSASAAQPSELFTPYTLYTPGTGGGGGSCGPSTNSPSADTVDGLAWNYTAGSSLWSCLDEPRGDTGTADSVTGYMDASRDAMVLRCTLAGGCDVTNIVVYTYGNTIGSTDTLNIRVSPDNSTWTSVQTQSYTGTIVERSATFSVSWTTPTYCYIEFTGATTTWNTVVIYNAQAVVNP